MRSRFPVIGFFLVIAAGSAIGQADPATIEKIVDEGKNRNQVVQHLTYLTKKIGPRLTSSPQLQKACEWTERKFKEFGCQNVHLEQWGVFPVGFDRGKKQIGRMIAPDKVDFQFTTSSWSPGTRGLVRGLAIKEPESMEEFSKVKDKLKGAWVIVTKARQVRRRGDPPPVPTETETAISGAGIAGRVFGSTNDLVITSGLYKIEWGKLPTEVRVMVRKKDMDAILAGISSGKDVTLEFNLENKFIKGPRPIYNVVAEIPGTEKPDEIVIIGGHLDSWDGPGSEGAQDNGTGTMVALEAARILCKAEAKPKRTIRFILFTGEEQGLLGSIEYVKQHTSETDKISAAFVDDGGTNYEGGVSCIASMESMLKEAIEPASKAFPEMPMSIGVVAAMRQGGGSDHASFNAVGVPGFFWSELGRGNYGFVHHTQNDRLETAIPEYLVQSSTNSAAAAYVLACSPTLLPRAPKPPAPPSGSSQ